jgi:hypothetical protein
MKTKAILITCAFLLGFSSCQREINGELVWASGQFKTFGIITGPDMRMCPSPCCGGWYIKIDTITYGFDSIPRDSNFDLQNTTFPIFVKLDWERALNQCSNNRITIHRIVRIYPPDK